MHSHPVKNLHLTYKGHYVLPLPYEYTFLAYCFEGPDTGASTDHTHCVVKLCDGLKKQSIIDDLTDCLE